MNLIADAPLDLRTAIIVVNAVIGVFVIGALVAAVLDRRRRPVVAPNKVTYHEDETLEGARLERMQGWALIMGAVVAISLPMYWLVEPTRQEAMGDQFLETSVEQGAELFAINDPEENPAGLGCAGCHGTKGEGGVANQIVTISKDEVGVTPAGFESADRICAPSNDNENEVLCQVAWKAPALNTVLLRVSREELREIIVYGRPGTPMPAWGLEGGGAKNDQSIDNVIDFLESIQLDSDKAKSEQGDLADGQKLYEANCARCHTKHWSYADTFAGNADFDIFAVPGGGAFGPNLTGEVTLRQFPDIKDHVGFITTGSDFQTAYGTRGIGSGRMPGFGRLLTADQVQAIVDYERSLQAGVRTKLDDLTGKTAPPPETTTTTAPAPGGEGQA